MTVDPSMFLPNAVDAETAAYNAELEAFLATVPSPHTLPPAVVRAARRAPQEGPPNKFRPPLVLSDKATVREIDGPAGNESALEVYPGGTHGFPGNPTALGARARKREEDFLRDAGKSTPAT